MQPIFAIMDHLPNGMMVLASDLTVVYWNRCLEHWTGIRQQQIVGRALAEHFPHLVEPRYLSRFSEVFSGGPPTIFSHQLHGQIIPSLLRNGDPRVQHTTITALKDPDGGGWLALFDIKDVSEMALRVCLHREAEQKAVAEVHRRQEVEKRLARANTELVEKNQEIQDFAHTCSHDLKTPLRTVSGMCQVLDKYSGTPLDQSGLEILKMIKQGAGQMQRLIDDLLSYALAGREGRPAEQVDLAVVAREVLAGLSGEIARGAALVEVEDLPVIQTNRVALHRVLLNLINNAIKYRHDDRPVRVRIRAEQRQGCWEVSVSDDGIGIDPAHHQRIFEPFKRLHSQSEYEGSGVGLAACKKAVDRLGGRIWVESEPGRGSVFRFTVPIDEPAADSTPVQDPVLVQVLPTTHPDPD